MTLLWEDRKVILCIGTGGVGKTTVSAAIGLAAARAGLRTLVMTIDPARRLANALGLAEFGNVEHEIPKDVAAQHGIELNAPLWVMMPDVKRTFDDLVERLTPDKERREKIFQNRLYQQFSTVLAGSLEYAAVEKVSDVYHSGRYDLIVLDTPPSQNATNFLEAPGKILDFFEHGTPQWLQKPYAAAGKFSSKLFDLGSSFVLRALGRMAGRDTIAELVEFITGFQGMYEAFRERSRQVRSLLTSEELAFVLITSTQPNQLQAVHTLRTGLHYDGMKVRAAVVNRVRSDPMSGHAFDAIAARVVRGLDGRPAGAVAAVTEALREEVELADQARVMLERFRELLGDTPLFTLPELPLDAHDLTSLSVLHAVFLSPGQGSSGVPGRAPDDPGDVPEEGGGQLESGSR